MRKYLINECEKLRPYCTLDSEDEIALCSTYNCICLRQGLLADTLKTLITTKLNSELLFVTLYTDKFYLDYDSLHTINLRALKKYYRDQIRKAGINDLMIIGAIDIQLLYFPYTDNGYRRKALWQPHLHLFLSSLDTQSQVKNKLSEVFRSNEYGVKPVQVTKVKGIINTKYVFKSLSSIRHKTFKDDRVVQDYLPKYVTGKYRLEMKEYMMINNIDQWVFIMGINKNEW